MHRYNLESYKGPPSRHHCPGCNNRQRTFTRYIDTTTGQYLAEQVGKCERANNCGYHYPPRQYFQDHPSQQRQPNPPTAKGNFRPLLAPHAPAPSYVPLHLLEATLRPGTPLEALAAGNVLIAFLWQAFGPARAAALVSRYLIGTSAFPGWEGAAVFWQVDRQGRIRTGKIIEYGLVPQNDMFAGLNARRNKARQQPAQWVHRAARLEGFALSQCLFGEHLLSQEPSKPVAVVESEKTAIIASAYLPEFVWIACGGLHMLSATRCQALKGRQVILYPDLKGFEQWDTKCRELAAFCRCFISDLLEKRATEAERAAGLDLADYLLRLPPPEEFSHTIKRDGKSFPSP